MSSTGTEISAAVRNSMEEVLSDAQRLIDIVRKEGGDTYGAALERVQDGVNRTQQELGDYRRSLARRTRRAVRRADDAVHEHPWATAGTAMVIGAAIAAIVAILSTRR